MNKSYLRGHEIEFINGEWVYSDTKEPTATTWNNRVCGHCGEFNTKEGHDYCLGTLPGVINACCGHGKPNETYIQFADGFVIRGQDAITIINILRRQK